MSKQRKGKFVADEGANRRYVAIGREEGWEVITVPPELLGIGMPDTFLTTKFTEGRHPILTSDKLSYTLTGKQLKRSGYIIHRTPSPGQAQAYEAQIRQFFRQHTERQTHGVKWIIEFTGAPTKEKLKEQTH
jgi:hypothetical protein